MHTVLLKRTNERWWNGIRTKRGREREKNTTTTIITKYIFILHVKLFTVHCNISSVHWWSWMCHASTTRFSTGSSIRINVFTFCTVWKNVLMNGAHFRLNKQCMRTVEMHSITESMPKRKQRKQQQQKGTRSLCLAGYWISTSKTLAQVNELECSKGSLITNIHRSDFMTVVRSFFIALLTKPIFKYKMKVFKTRRLQIIFGIGIIHLNLRSKH